MTVLPYIINLRDNPRLSLMVRTVEIIKEMRATLAVVFCFRKEKNF